MLQKGGCLGPALAQLLSAGLPDVFLTGHTHPSSLTCWVSKGGCLRQLLDLIHILSAGSPSESHFPGQQDGAHDRSRVALGCALTRDRLRSLCPCLQRGLVDGSRVGAFTLGESNSCPGVGVGAHCHPSPWEPAARQQTTHENRPYPPPAPRSAN